MPSPCGITRGPPEAGRESRNGVGVVLCNVNSEWMAKVGERNAEDATYFVEWETHEYGRRAWLKVDNSIYVVKFEGSCLGVVIFRPASEGECEALLLQSRPAEPMTFTGMRLRFPDQRCPGNNLL
jgi:hypothetical protein